MNIYFDMEFTGLHQQTTLISFGAVTDTGKEFYVELNDYDEEQLDPWLKENVIAKLKTDNSVKMSHRQCAITFDFWLHELAKQKGTDDKFVMVSDCYAYDWVLFCELYGGALHIPDSIYYIPQDLSTLFAAANIDPDINRERYAGIVVYNENDQHNALHDAHVIRMCYKKLRMEHFPTLL